jgi:dihydroorotase
MAEETTTTSNTPKRLTLRRPDDFHHHVRDGKAIASVLQHAVPRFGRLLCMPNLQPPVTTTELALAYKQRILDSLPSDWSTSSPHFQPVMTLYLTDNTTPDEIRKASQVPPNADGTPVIVGCKYYPAGATTNSEFGVSNFKNLYPTLAEMQTVGMMLCIHSEVTHADIFDREPVFIEEIMKPLVRDFPTLKITMEHISTIEAVNYVWNEAPDHVKASITCHHLMYNRNRKLEYLYETMCAGASLGLVG